MLQNLPIPTTPLGVLSGVVGLLLSVSILARISYIIKFQRAGGVSAPKLKKAPFGGFYWVYQIIRAHLNNQLLELFTKQFVELGGNYAELNMLGTQRVIVTQEPEHIKTILTGKFADYGKGNDFHRAWAPFLGDSIFATDGRQWQESRNLIRPMFVKNRVSDLYTFERYTQNMLSCFPKPGVTFNVQELFYRLTVDVITEFLLGESVNSLLEPRSEFVQAFNEVQRIQVTLTLLMPLDRFYPHGKYYRGIAVMDKLIIPYIDRALSLDPAELEKLSKSDREFTFLHALAGYTRDRKVIRDQIIAILLAGRDTTAATLSWTIYEIARQPAIWAKLRSEVLEVVGREKEPSYDDLKALKYMTHCLNETLRLYPAVPLNIRYALQDTTLPSLNGGPDITVVKGDGVQYSAINMQRRAELYPAPSATFAPAHVFQPERWETWQPVPWQYVPFNGGPRICVGQNFALTEMAFVLVRLVQKYARLEYRGTGTENPIAVDIVGCPSLGVDVAFWEDEKA